jgi:hypothetical protein
VVLLDIGVQYLLYDRTRRYGKVQAVREVGIRDELIDVCVEACIRVLYGKHS